MGDNTGIDWLAGSEAEADVELQQISQMVSLVLAYSQEKKFRLALSMIPALLASISRNESSDMQLWRQFALQITDPQLYWMFNNVGVNVEANIFSEEAQMQATLFRSPNQLKIFVHHILTNIAQYLNNAVIKQQTFIDLNKEFIQHIRYLQSAIETENENAIIKGMNTIIIYLQNPHLSRDLVSILSMSDLQTVLDRIYTKYQIRPKVGDVDTEVTIRTEWKEKTTSILAKFKLFQQRRQIRSKLTQIMRIFTPPDVNSASSELTSYPGENTIGDS